MSATRAREHDPAEGLDAWEARLRALADRLRECARETMRGALERGELAAVDRPMAEGAGDVSFGLDLPAEEVLADWLTHEARRAPLSLLTEERGWRHLGPDPRDPGAAAVELAGFDHGGPRIVVDPIDGTRNLMADLRSAWTAIAFCPPGPAEPRFGDVQLALVAELPDSRAARYRILAARAEEGARAELRELAGDGVARSWSLAVDADDRPDHGYFSFFCFSPAMRPRIAELAARFFERLARREGADPSHCFDDQYISNAGQLALLALGTYRLIADLRAVAGDGLRGPLITSKPYDCAAGLLIAREAGCAVTGPDGSALDFPLDARTPVAFVGYANEPTRARLAPHLSRALDECDLGGYGGDGGDGGATRSRARGSSGT